MGAPVKRIELADALEGWDTDCYAYTTPYTVEDRQAFRAALKLESEEAQEQWQLELIESHFVSGKVKEFDPAAGEFKLVKMTKDHLQLAVVSDLLFAGIVGLELDPKALAASLELSSLNELQATETPSSETSGQTSPTKPPKN